MEEEVLDQKTFDSLTKQIAQLSLERDQLKDFVDFMKERERDNIQNRITPPMMFVEVPAPDSRLHKQMGYLIEAKEELDNIPNWVRRVFKKKGQEDDGNNM